MKTTLEALEQLGASQNLLSLDQKQFLDENGYLPFEGVLSSTEVDMYNEKLQELLEKEGENAGKEVHQEAGTARLSNLIDKDPIFEKFINHPSILAAVAHVLGQEFKLSSLNSRAALPGGGAQELHVDWMGKPVEFGNYKVCNSIWLLDDFTEFNGATRLVPGTHRIGKAPDDVLSDKKAKHPDQIQIIAKAGTVVVFNSHTWHGGVINQSKLPRRAVHAYFTHADQEQQLNQKKSLRPETLERLSQASRIILDV